MRRLVSIAVFLSIFAFVPLAAQDDGPTVWEVMVIESLDAKYTTYLQEVLYPVYDEMVRTGVLISYDVLVPWTGSGETTHMAIVEYPSWDDLDGPSAAQYNEASQAVHGIPWTEVTADYFPLSEIRKVTSRNVYGSTKP